MDTPFLDTPFGPTRVETLLLLAILAQALCRNVSGILWDRFGSRRILPGVFLGDFFWELSKKTRETPMKRIRENPPAQK